MVNIYCEGLIIIVNNMECVQRAFVHNWVQKVGVDEKILSPKSKIFER